MSRAEAVIEHVEREEVATLAEELVRIQSPTGEEADIAEFILCWLEEQAGMKPIKQEIEPGRFNAIGKFRGSKSGDGNSLLFNGHIDTSQFGIEHEDFLIHGDGVPDVTPRREDGKLYGTGALNDKGPTAATMIAAKALNDAGVELGGDLYVTAVAGELGKAPVDEFQGPRYRGHGIGARHLVDNGVTADYAIVAENSEWGVVYGLPGAIYLKITVPGVSKYIPNIDYTTVRDEHALFESMDLIEHIYDWAQSYTTDNTVKYDGREIVPNVNVGAFRSGHPAKPNYQSGIGQLYIDIRTPPNRTLQSVRNEFTRMVRETNPDAEVECYRALPGYAQSRSVDDQIDTLVSQIEESYQSVFDQSVPEPPTYQNSKWNDNNIFVSKGIPTAKIAPGHPGDLKGGATVEIDQLVDAAKLYTKCALSICGSA